MVLCVVTFLTHVHLTYIVAEKSMVSIVYFQLSLITTQVKLQNWGEVKVVVNKC